MNALFSSYMFDGFTFAGMDFATLSCVMVFYGFIGWVYESTIFSLGEQGKLMDRGMYIGPICPIYAMVSVISLQLFAGVNSPLKILLLSGLATCVVEYFTSVVFEKLFHKRYWDYSYYPLNIDGRVSVISGLFFGIALLIMMRVLHPMTLGVLERVPLPFRRWIAMAAWSLFFVDALWTVIGNTTKNNRVKEVYDEIIAWKQLQFDKANARCETLEDKRVVRAGKTVLNKGKEINRKCVDLENRIKERYRK